MRRPEGQRRSVASWGHEGGGQRKERWVEHRRRHETTDRPAGSKVHQPMPDPGYSTSSGNGERERIGAIRPEDRWSRLSSSSCRLLFFFGDRGLNYRTKLIPASRSM